jgi:hypothetical protein
MSKSALHQPRTCVSKCAKAHQSKTGLYGVCTGMATSCIQLVNYTSYLLVVLLHYVEFTPSTFYWTNCCYIYIATGIRLVPMTTVIGTHNMARVLANSGAPGGQLHLLLLLQSQLHWLPLPNNVATTPHQHCYSRDHPWLFTSLSDAQSQTYATTKNCIIIS